MSFLKIQTSSNQMFNVDLGTTETDFIKLLACLSNIEQDKIKGLRDKFGNYFTLYSAIYNPQGNFNYSNVYYLVCSNENINRNINYYILDRFENLPNNEIPISFSHDSNNYYKRNKIPHVNNNRDYSQIRSDLYENQVNENINPRTYSKETQSMPRPYSNRNPSSNCYAIDNAYADNYINKSGNLCNIDHSAREANMNFPTDNTKIQSLYFKNQYQQNTPNNFNLTRIPNKQNYDLNFYSKNSDLNYSKNNDSFDYFSLDNRLLNKNRNNNMNNYTHNNYGRNILSISNNLDNHQDNLEHDLDHLKRNLVPETNFEYNNYFNARRSDRYPQKNSGELITPQNRFTQTPKDLNNFNHDYSRNQQTSYNNIYFSSNNLKILKERKLNESNKIKENSSNSVSRDVKQLQIEKYLSIANDLGELSLIDNKYLPKLKQLILNHVYFWLIF